MHYGERYKGQRWVARLAKAEVKWHTAYCAWHERWAGCPPETTADRLAERKAHAAFQDGLRDFERLYTAVTGRTGIYS
jgi:hypothetical protein